MENVKVVELRPEHLPIFMEFIQLSVCMLLPKIFKEKETIDWFFDSLKDRCKVANIDNESVDSFIDIMHPTVEETRKAFIEEEQV